MAGRADLYGDLSYFMPKKGFFREPGQYEAALKAEATKKASYLADIEQFYTQLEESARQFDLSYDLQNRSLQQQANLFAQQQRTQRDIARDQIWAGVGTGMLTTAVDAYLKNKDITFQFDWMDDLMEKLNIFDQESGLAESFSFEDYLDTESDIFSYDLPWTDW